ncbi:MULTISPECIES: hypothetical protein [Aeromonas]|jgi:hypothetical protein|uniref:Uncharacterized protein n=3 Tax=Bacteria TaxID=2 RepID=A0A3L0VVJ1_ECOLX|nr:MULTISPECIES: hypothetical protein [Aeromonas]ELI6432836.1 hypothetical protein [Aeromonas salmonicida subsp. salmonicida]MBP8159516.1 hypothetical protein [Aeromonas sp.]ARW80901.1 hypothetical protein O23A_p0147 [Aeromonas salmonicida]ATP10789.1 uncharacterized protein Asalp_36980 [Aeromonas salmonicida subsp. pectinolytica 34mel]EQC06008.1 hypothetical protein K931_01759 [Aeromonas salmonicida subsp. pectinolytica 34mel]
MMDNLMLFLIISVFAVFYWVYYTGSRKSPFTTQWETLPTKEQYLAAHPEAIDGDIIFCIHCGHHQQLDVGLLHQTDFRRQHICTRCKKAIYREEI